MITPSHHPSPERLLEYAAGSLEAGRRLVIDTHVRLCPDCQGETRLVEAVGGALLERLPAADLSPDALQRALARIEAAAPSASSSARLATPSSWIDVPAEVARAATRRIQRAWEAAHG